MEAVGGLDEAERDMTNLATMHSSHPPATTFDKPCIYIYNKQPTIMVVDKSLIPNLDGPLNLSLLQFFDFDLPS